MRSRGCSRDRELLRMSPEACAPDLGPRDLHVRHLPPALAARLLVAPARSGCISVILGALPSGGRQALQLGRVLRARPSARHSHTSSSSAGSHGSPSNCGGNPRRRFAQAGHDGAATSGVEATAIDGSRRLGHDFARKIEHKKIEHKA